MPKLGIVVVVIARKSLSIFNTKTEQVTNIAYLKITIHTHIIYYVPVSVHPIGLINFKNHCFSTQKSVAVFGANL